MHNFLTVQSAKTEFPYLRVLHSESTKKKDAQWFFWQIFSPRFIFVTFNVWALWHISVNSEFLRIYKYNIYNIFIVSMLLQNSNSCEKLPRFHIFNLIQASLEFFYYSAIRPKVLISSTFYLSPPLEDFELFALFQFFGRLAG